MHRAYLERTALGQDRGEGEAWRAMFFREWDRNRALHHELDLVRDELDELRLYFDVFALPRRDQDKSVWIDRTRHEWMD